MTAEDFAQLALALPGAIESAHFGKRDFRIGNKIFASLPAADRAVVNFTPEQQAMMVAVEPDLFAPLANAWGAKGWTSLDIAACPEDLARHGLELAAAGVAAKRAKSPKKG